MIAKKIVGISLISLGLVLIGVFVVLQQFKSHKPNAGLKVDSYPGSQVFVDGHFVGHTPLDKIYLPGEISVKLVPDASSSAVANYDTKVQLTSSTYTVVKRDFGSSDAASAGEIVSLQPDTPKSASLSVVTSFPDSASVSLDGQPLGFTPLVVPDIPAGDHQVVVSAPGFNQRMISAKSVSGYKLILNVKLQGSYPAISPITTPIPVTTVATASATLSSTVTITETPTGHLNVRSQPSLGGTKVAEVDPGQSFSVLDSKTGWYQIKLDLSATSSGWISSQYAKKSN